MINPLYFYKKRENNPIRRPNKGVSVPVYVPHLERTHHRSTSNHRSSIPLQNQCNRIRAAWNFPTGGGGRKKIRGRSPVPWTGTIIEPHTDIFPDIVSTLFSSQKSSCKNFPDTPRGLIILLWFRYPIWYHLGYRLGIVFTGYIIKGKESKEITVFR
mgnify:CR=1 FL=1